MIQPARHRPWRRAGAAWRALSLSLGLALAATGAMKARAQTTAAAPEKAGAGKPHSGPADQPFIQPESTRRMVALLDRIRQEANPLGDNFLSAERAELMAQRLAQLTNGLKIAEFIPVYAQQLLHAGRSEQALLQFDRVEPFARENNLRLSPRTQSELRLFRALCLLRIGEQENCLANHNAESCLFPIRGGGVHQLPRGSLGAVKILTEQLTLDAADLQARWLLNLAYMTLGQYPDKVPPPWVIPPEKFASDYDIKPFPDVAMALGLDVNGLSGGVIMEDFDGDGFLDLMVSDWSLRGQLKYFHNDGDGTFSERTAAAGLTGITGGLNLQQTDYNNDGRPDVFVLRGAWQGPNGRFPRSLLRNNGDGTFTDVTVEAGLLTLHPTQTATWLDYDGDGWLDVFIGNESAGPQSRRPCQLFHNNRDGTFTDCAAAGGVDLTAFVKGVVAGDFDNDGRPDLFVSVRDQPNRLFHNDGPRAAGGGGAQWSFTEVSARAGVSEPVRSFGTWFFDYDNDGWPDLLVFGYGVKDVSEICADYLGLPHHGEKSRVYHNNHDGTFTDVTKAVGLDKVIHAMGCNFGDLDNDGWLDFYAGTGDPDLATLIPSRMFRNNAGRGFQEVTTSGGFGMLQKGHGIAFGDLDNDGDQDVYSVVGGAYTGDTGYNQLFLNPGHGNHWLTLKLAGRESNRVALGARIKVNTIEAGAPRAIYKTVSTGGTFGASPLRQEIGLGQATEITSVEIFWPTTGKTQTLTGLQRDRFYQVTEGDAQATLWDVKPVHLNLAAKPGRAHDHPRLPAVSVP